MQHSRGFLILLEKLDVSDLKIEGPTSHFHETLKDLQGKFTKVEFEGSV